MRPRIRLLGVGEAERALVRIEHRLLRIGGVRVAIPPKPDETKGAS
jgi:hypothetical protein